jgi:beta-lactamase class A
MSALAAIVLLAGLVIDVGARRRTHLDVAASAGARRASDGKPQPTSPTHVTAGKLEAAVDPLTTNAMRSYLATRSGSVTAAVEDLRTRQTWLYQPGARDQTGSIIKADILETLLRQAEVSRRSLDGADPAVIQGMIENSDNDDATDLWNLVGGSTGVGAYNVAAGLAQTDLNTQGYWGETTTSAADQIRLLHELVLPSRLLDVGSQRYELDLMEHIESDQDWGVSGGVPAGVSVALKNGWLPLTTDADWEINSVGRIKGDGRWYLLAVLTAHDFSMPYGISTISRMSTLIWNGLKPVIGKATKPRALSVLIAAERKDSPALVALNRRRSRRRGDHARDRS